MQIFVKTITETIIKLEVEPIDSIASVKQKIQKIQEMQDIECVSFENQKIIFNKRQLDENNLLFSYNIKEGDTLQLINGMLILIGMIFKKPTPLEVNQHDMIKIVKQKINDKIGVRPENQRLFFNNEQLNDNKTLLDYCVYKNMIIHLVYKFPKKSKSIEN